MFFYFNALQNHLKYIKALKYLRLMLHTVFNEIKISLSIYFRNMKQRV